MLCRCFEGYRELYRQTLYRPNVMLLLSSRETPVISLPCVPSVNRWNGGSFFCRRRLESLLAPCSDLHLDGVNLRRGDFPRSKRIGGDTESPSSCCTESTIGGPIDSFFIKSNRDRNARFRVRGWERSLAHGGSRQRTHRFRVHGTIAMRGFPVRFPPVVARTQRPTTE